MRTGEGKTLVATLPAYLNALSGKGVHVVTVNDYLSRRDAVWMGQIYNALGLSVSVINHESSFLYDPTHKESKDTNTDDKLDKERDETGAFKVVHEFLRPCTRTEAYAADITYGTNNEFGFDYLRDNLEYSRDRLRQRPFNFAIVDEIDSILIDEARTPLIISAPTRDAENIYRQFASLVSSFVENEDYTVEEKHKAIQLTESGINKAEKYLGVDNIYTDKGVKYVHHLETAVRAKAIFHKDKEYVVRDGEVMIVDEDFVRFMRCFEEPYYRSCNNIYDYISALIFIHDTEMLRSYEECNAREHYSEFPLIEMLIGATYGIDHVVNRDHTYAAKMVKLIERLA
jgi:preprotein translocase subunit SecA